MIAYIIRRLMIGVLTLLMITFLIFGLVRAMPGSPLTINLAEIDPGKSTFSKEDQERMREHYGLNKSWPVAYVDWLGKVVRLDLDRSFSRKQPVLKLIGERVGPTLALSVTSLILAYLLSIPLGLWSTVRNGTFRERTVSTILYMLYSLPSFVAALFLQILLAVKLGWLPLFGMRSDSYAQMSTLGQTWDLMLHAIMPVICFTYGTLAFETRFIKSNMLEVIRQDYIRTARAKGVAPWRIVWHHAFRNTLIPFVTMVGLTLPGLLSGAVILEQIFVWPGMGNLFFGAIDERDYPTIMGLVLIFSVLTLAGQLLADILYSIVDPRVSLS